MISDSELLLKAMASYNLFINYCIIKTMIKSKQTFRRYLQKNGTHHCPGVNKYLVVNYTCIPDSKGVVLCDSEEATLECKAGWKIDISDAFWGRRANSKYCPTGMQEMECDNGPSAKINLKKKCDGLSTCIVKATSDELEDKKTVCPGNLLYLLLNYACRAHSSGNLDNARVIFRLYSMFLHETA